MIDPIQKLADIYPDLKNGHQATAREVKEAILDMQGRIADLESTLERGPQPEALASLSARVVDPITQIEWQVTVRDGGPARLCLLISAMPVINESLAGQGLIAFDAYVDGRRAFRQAQDAAERQENNKALPEPTAGKKSPNQLPSDALTFKAENLVKSTEGDKTYYKVKGGKFAQFGVTIWPEALAEAGFDLDTLGGVTPLAGYTAHYILNDKGKPAKVIGLQLA